MTREFIDSLSFIPESQLQQHLKVANLLGFSEVWISNSTNNVISKNSQSPYSPLIRMYKRLDIGLKNETKEQLLSILRKQRRNTPIIAITCLTPELTAWAAQDNRVDILKFPVFQTGKLMTRSIAKLMIKFHKHLEIPLSHLYSLPSYQQIPAFRQIRSALEIAVRKKVPIIFTSGSNSADQMRTPRELASLGQVLLSSSMIPLDTLSSIPHQLINQNLGKITSDYISPGVERIPFPPMEEE
ncbi:MAG: RNase P subunit p30 family protein [Candidatus Hodarchaeales archaeon]